MSREQLVRLHSLIWSTRHLPLCRSNWSPGKPSRDNADDRETDTLEFTQPGTPHGAVRYRIITRSTFGIYQFLGRLLAKSDELDSAFLASEDADQHLLTIVKDQTTGCFDRVNYKDSEYCVPEGAKYTKQILQLLAQLLALQTQAGDLAITPTVRVTP